MNIWNKAKSAPQKISGYLPLDTFSNGWLAKLLVDYRVAFGKIGNFLFRTHFAGCRFYGVDWRVFDARSFGECPGNDLAKRNVFRGLHALILALLRVQSRRIS